MELILIMQHIELSTWTFSTEVLFFASAMALFALILSSITSDSFVALSQKGSDDVDDSDIAPRSKFAIGTLLFASYLSLFVSGTILSMLSLALLVISIGFSFVLSNNIKSAIARCISILATYLILRFGMVDYFDCHNSIIFAIFAIFAALPLIAKIKVAGFAKMRLIAGLIVALSFSGYSYNTNRVITEPSIQDFHYSIKNDLRAGLDTETLSRIYDAKITKTEKEPSDIVTSGLRNKFTSQPLERITTSQVVDANGINYEVSSDNHGTIIYTQAKVSTIIMLLMPGLLWLFAIAYLGNKHHTTRTIKENE